MKKFLLSALMLFIISDLFAQTKFGIKGGVNFSSLSTEGDNDLDSKTGIYMGATVAFPVTDNIRVQPELLFSTKGYSGNELGGELETSFN